VSEEALSGRAGDLLGEHRVQDGPDHAFNKVISLDIVVLHSGKLK
jgi:hypothetical protein